LSLGLLDASAGAREVVAHLVTVAMLAAPKAVVVEGADAFAEEVDAERELSRARELWQAKRQRDAARRLLKLVRGAGWSAADLAFGSRSAPAAGRWRKEIGAAPEEADKAWLQELSAWAEEQRLSAPPEDLEALAQAVERDLRLIAAELEKLASYAGERALISRTDVEAVVAPVREEEFFALGEAVGEGDLGSALQLFHDELRRKASASAVALPFLGGVAAAI